MGYGKKKKKRIIHSFDVLLCTSILVSQGTENFEKLFSELKVRYENRNGGYTRVLKAGLRMHDKAPMAILELVDNKLPPRRPEIVRDIGMYILPC